MNIGINLASIGPQAVAQVEAEAENRAFAAANELKNASMEVLRGQRSGKTYKKPGGGTYTASAPGEPPAVRTGRLRNSWRPVTNGKNPAIELNVPVYPEYMEHGTPGGMIAPRPFVQKIVDMAEPQVTAIYNAPYNLHF